MRIAAALTRLPTSDSPSSSAQRARNRPLRRPRSAATTPPNPRALRALRGHHLTPARQMDTFHLHDISQGSHTFASASGIPGLAVFHVHGD
jgi:hypothetical protein